MKTVLPDNLEAKREVVGEIVSTAKDLTLPKQVPLNNLKALLDIARSFIKFDKTYESLKPSLESSANPELKTSALEFR